MVILFKGTDKSKNYAPQAVALCAGLSATKFYKKTLVIQLTSRYPVEDYLIGKKKSELSIDNRAYLFEDSGIDSLMRRVGVAAFRKEHFANAVTAAVNSENLFDILDVSKKTEEDLIRELEATPTIVGAIIKAATKIYDNIFVLVNGRNADLIKEIIPYMEKTVTCIPQSIKEEINAESTEDNCYLITNYDYKSAYGIRQMTKFYGGKMFTMPYNVDFKDYYTNNNMLQYILHNISPKPEDYSFHLISEMTKLCEYLLDVEEYEDNSLQFSVRTLKRIYEPETQYTGSNVEISEHSGGFFKAKVTDIHINNNRHKKETPLDFHGTTKELEFTDVDDLYEDDDSIKEDESIYEDKPEFKDSRKAEETESEKPFVKDKKAGRRNKDKGRVKAKRLEEVNYPDEAIEKTAEKKPKKRGLFAKKEKEKDKSKTFQDAVDDFLEIPVTQQPRKAEEETSYDHPKKKKDKADRAEKTKKSFKKIELASENKSKPAMYDLKKRQEAYEQDDDDYYYDEEDMPEALDHFTGTDKKTIKANIKIDPPAEDEPFIGESTEEDDDDYYLDEDFEEFDLNG